MIDAVADSAPSPSFGHMQMGEFLRKWISRRLLALNKADVGKVSVAMRALGGGTPGGAEALAEFHQLIYELWQSGGLQCPLARIKVDEKNCFGRLEWPAVRSAVYETLPRHYPVTCWKHRAVSEVEQPGVAAAPKDRGAEQGDVDGSLECGLTIGGVATRARQRVHTQQRRGELPWNSQTEGGSTEANLEFDTRAQRVGEWAGTAPSERRSRDGNKAILTDPSHEIQRHGGLADFWYMDDGDILCHPRLVVPYFRSFDSEDGQVGGERNRSKSEVIYYVDQQTLDAHAAEWQVPTVQQLAAVSTAACPSVTLGVATGPQAALEAQIQQKVEVVRAMHERVAIASDPQTERVLDRECLGVGRVNHILRAHGDQLLRGGETLDRFDAATRQEMDRLFPGLSEEGHTQASLAAAFGGLGWRRASETVAQRT